ncbi:MAG: hypothetical protein AAGJ28_15315 [Pseudomonadota bacterium]
MIRTRQVWYFHGFDPATTARYRRIFEAASERFSADISDLPDGGDGWQVSRDGVTARINYCRYEDLVRDFQYAPLWRRALRGYGALWGYARDGALARMWRLGKRNLGLALSPLFVALVALGLGVGVMTAIAGMAGLSSVPMIVIAALIWALALMIVAYPAFYLHLVADLFAYMRVLALGQGGDWATYRQRVAGLSEMIQAGEEDETLLVGHSLGGLAAIFAIEALLDRWPQGRPIALLTLGSVHGAVLVQKGAGRDRLAEAVRRVATDRRVFWLDVTSPRDSFCLPLIDPLVFAGTIDGAESPRVISTRLARAPRIPGDRRTVFAAMRRHMGYLLAPQPGSGFDYADVVSGEISLKDRFVDRPNSPRARMVGA